MSLKPENVEIALSVLFAFVVELSSGLLLAFGAYGMELRRMRRGVLC